MTPTHKKLLSAFAVIVAGAALTLLNSYALHFGVEVQGFVASVTGGGLLLLKAWGTAEEQAAKVEAKATEKAIGMVNEAASRES